MLFQPNNNAFILQCFSFYQVEEMQMKARMWVIMEQYLVKKL